MINRGPRLFLSHGYTRGWGVKAHSHLLCCLYWGAWRRGLKYITVKVKYCDILGVLDFFPLGTLGVGGDGDTVVSSVASTGELGGEG